MTIQIIGSDLKSRIVYENALKAVAESGIKAEVVKVTEIDDIAKMGVMMTPAVAVDDAVKTVGKTLTKDDILSILEGKNKRNCSTCPVGGGTYGSCCCS